MEIKPIETELGIIKGRDSILIKAVETFLYPLSLKLSGTVDGTHCTYKLNDRSIPFHLFFNSVEMYNCFMLDFSPVDKDLQSSFDEVIDSELLESMRLLKTHKHYIISTYDHVFEVAAKAYDFKLI